MVSPARVQPRRSRGRRDAHPLNATSRLRSSGERLSEGLAALHGFSRTHPLQPDATVQGTLELLWRLERILCEITGMVRATVQPPAGACGELTGLLMMRAYHTDHGDPRDTVSVSMKRV